MYPIKFQPVYKEKVWGGNRLKEELLKEVAATTDIGESWEIACHREGSSKIINGEYKGLTLNEFMYKSKNKVFGELSDDFKGRFPLLVKFIDAKDKLSVQVHPDDEYAMLYENDLGKTEMWYIVDAKPGAKLVYGLKEGVTKTEFSRAIESNNLENTLQEIEVKKGDVLFIPAGTLHAIGEDILIAEIQQNSDTTYRVYDWGRLGLNGSPRELHIDRALEVINFKKTNGSPQIEGLTIQQKGYSRTIYVSCKYFTTEVIDIKTEYSDLFNGKRFEIFMCIDGELEITYSESEVEKFCKGQTILMPANIGDFSINGKGRMIRTYMIQPKDLYNHLLDTNYSNEDMSKIGGLKI